MRKSVADRKKDPELEAEVGAVRRFNRVYTREIGVLQEGLLESPFSLAEVRVLYELAHRDTPTATEIGRTLELDAGYLSRIVRRFEKDGLLARQPAASDKRQSLLQLTRKGKTTFEALDGRSQEQVRTMLARLSAAEKRRLVGAMGLVERLLAPAPSEAVPYLLRTHQPGDLGWVIHRHGALYAEEHGWDERFEALVARIAADFIDHFDPKRERCWIAERDGEIVGSVLLVKKDSRTAQLRLLLVEPKARGLGIGTRLLSECIRFGSFASYKKITLWTNDVLTPARRLYETAGFRLVEETPHNRFGKDMLGQIWELKL